MEGLRRRRVQLPGIFTALLLFGAAGIVAMVVAFSVGTSSGQRPGPLPLRPSAAAPAAPSPTDTATPTPPPPPTPLCLSIPGHDKKGHAGVVCATPGAATPAPQGGGGGGD